jgi:biopolymer transport protein ExbD
MAAKLGGDSEDPIAEINIVPFVDIILVILIIFMVTTPLIMKPSINVNLPKAASGDDSTPSKLSVSITPKGEIYLNGKPSTAEEVQSYSATVSKENPDIQAIISADKDVTHGKVVEIIDAVKTGGVKKFAITIDQKK